MKKKGLKRSTFKAKKIKIPRGFPKRGYWHIEKMELINNRNLKILLVAQKVERTPEDLIAEKAGIRKAYPIVVDYSIQYIVHFFQPLAFQRLDESFADEKGEYSSVKKPFGVYTESEYLKYFSKVSFGIVDEPILHYCITCSDDIVSVISTEPPEIIRVK